ncbi:MAG: hypothetical protein J0H66_06350 [Solirubrobacterales bacterium]|nr:hypothetical protein [Solirubrobacterales bacterium]OJU94945.1 MAG: hypothetical protein BGO23_07190 [Solirubrobacterales bacterium 67-14]
MNFRGIAVKAGVLIAALVASLTLAAPVTSAKQSKPPVFWIDLSGTAEQHPGMVIFTANAGPQVYKLKWTGWGKNKTVGHGTYRVTSPPPPDGKNPKGPAKIVAWKPVKCVPEFGNRKGKTIRVYRHAKMLRPVPEGGRKWVDISGYTGRPTCK